jgi:NADH-quinone oxidoreductase subunit G
LGIAEREEAGLIEVPEAANGRGLREVGCLPDLGPGLADAPTQGMTAAEAGRAVGDGIDALLLLHVDPVREHPEQAVWQDALDNAGAVISFASFRTDGLDRHADVVFPAESYAETEGTVTHPDGRVQRVRQAVGHPNQVRPTWSVLAELSARVGAPLEATSVPTVTAEVAAAVPFYAGLTLEEIGGRGVRWQEREAASSLPAAELPDAPLEEPPELPDGLRLGAVPSLWTGRETAHAPSLRFLEPRQRVQLAPEDARRLGVRSGDEVVVSTDGRSVNAVAAVRGAVKPGSVFLLAGTEDDSATALGNGDLRVVEVAKAAGRSAAGDGARVPAEAPS